MPQPSPGGFRPFSPGERDGAPETFASPEPKKCERALCLADFGTRRAYISVSEPKGAVRMKFSREYRTEDEARACEASLRAARLRAWHTRKADGKWQVFWWVRP